MPILSILKSYKTLYQGTQVVIGMLDIGLYSKERWACSDLSENADLFSILSFLYLKAVEHSQKPLS